MSSTKSRKRKQPQRVRRTQPVPEDREAPFQLDPTLFIQAHEADISRGPQAHALALSLEVSTYEDNNGRLRVKAGDGLIRWQGATHQRNSEFEGDEEEVVSLGRTHTHEKPHNGDEEVIWVDRYASPATRVLWTALGVDLDGVRRTLPILT